MPSSFLKTMILLMSPISLFKDSRIDLPLECKDFKLIKGDPFNARTVILGEEHYVCDQARFLCTESIINYRRDNSKISPEEVSILFEELDRDQKALCEEGGYEKLSKDCRGWNIPGKKMKEVHGWYMKAIVMQNLQTQFRVTFQELLLLPKVQSTQQAANYVGGYIKQGKVEVHNREAEYSDFMKKYGKKEPNLTSYTLDHLEKAQFKQHQLNIIFKKIKKGDSLYDIWMYMIKESDKYTDLYNNFRIDHNASFAKPNKEIPKAIKEGISKGKKLMFVYAGNRHVNTHFTRPDATPLDPTIVQALYNDLDRFAEINPYAVLSCNLK
jgi:hypothetical protein